jgi:hypothetical protein
VQYSPHKLIRSSALALVRVIFHWFFLPETIRVISFFSARARDRGFFGPRFG